MSYQPPDDPYQQQTRASFTPPPPPPPPANPPQDQQPWYKQQSNPPPPPQQQQQYRGPGEVQPAWNQQVQPAAQPGYPQQGYPQPAYQAQAAPPAYQAPGAQPGYQAPGAHRQTGGKQYGLRGAEVFWYFLGCLDFGMAYFSKIPSKKAGCEIYSELQLDGQGPSQGYSLNGAESVWYFLMCLAFGAGYFAKVWAKKAQWELVGMIMAAPGDGVQAISRALSGSASQSGAAAQYPPRY